MGRKREMTFADQTVVKSQMTSLGVKLSNALRMVFLHSFEVARHALMT